MILKIYKYLIVLFLPIFICSCYTSVKVRKVVTGKEMGIRYSLAKPFIKVVPNSTGDGSYTVSVEYLPDESQTYAIDAKSIMASHTLHVVVEDRLLTKIQWNPNDTAVAEELVKKGGALASSVKTRLTEERSAREQKKDAARQAMETARDKILSKELEIQIATADLESWKSSVDLDSLNSNQKETLRTKELEIEKKEIEFEALKKKLENLDNTFTDHLDADEAITNERTAWGPVWFEVIDTYNHKDESGDVKLIAVEWEPGIMQKQFGAARVPEEAKPDVKAPKLIHSGAHPLAFEENKDASIRTAFDTTIKSIKTNDITIEKIPMEDFGIHPFNQFGSVLLTNLKDLILTFTKVLSPGEYAITIPFTFGDKRDKSATVTIIVHD